MQRYVVLPFVALLLTGCADNETFGTTPPTGPTHRVMPDLNQGASPDQRRAIMAGERPDWSDNYPMPRIPKK